MTLISVEVVDGVHGRAAEGVTVSLERRDGTRWSVVATGSTADDGFVPALYACSLGRGRHRLAVRPSSYFAGLGSVPHYHEFVVDFQVTDVGDRLRLTVYLCPAGFTAYCQRD